MTREEAKQEFLRELEQMPDQDETFITLGDEGYSAHQLREEFENETELAQNLIDARLGLEKLIKG